VFALLETWATAELRGDVPAHDQLLSDDFTGIGPVGFVLDAHQWSGRHRGDLTNKAFDIIDPHVRFYGDVAVVEALQRQDTTARGHNTSGSFRLGAVCARVGGEWRLAHVQLSGPIIHPDQTPEFAR
jgi:hypothetical protein